MLGHRLRRCPNIKPALIKRVLFTVVFTTNNVASVDEWPHLTVRRFDIQKLVSH